jgi:hypothetical protein
MRVLVTLSALLCVAAAPVSTGQDAVDAFQCSAGQHVDRANVDSVYAAYGSRSGTIIGSALARDKSRLTKMIAPGSKPDEAVLATFKYLNGVLVGVDASSVYLTRGAFPKPSMR